MCQLFISTVEVRKRGKEEKEEKRRLRTERKDPSLKNSSGTLINERPDKMS